MTRPPGFALRLYRGAAPLVASVVPLAAPFSAKLAAGLAGRRGVMDRLRAAAVDLQGALWVHVTSVGEYEQARPIIAAVRSRLGAGAPPVAVTHYSPSGVAFARRHPCGDLHDYLPFDRPADMRRLVALWRPRLLLFVKFDCWPNLVLAAEAAGVPVVLLAATLQPRSGRLHPLARPLFRDVFDRFRHIGAVSAEDRDRFVTRLGVRCPVTVTGDTRAEQVLRRFEAAAGGETAARLQTLGRRRLVLGSTWPPDEKLWLPVLPKLLERHPDLRVVLVPHEPLPERLAGLEAALARRGLRHARLSAFLSAPASAPAVDPHCVIVDSVGVLAEIYRAGTLAYVGGSFTTGVHNTLEPAVAQLPVLFGPRIENAEEASRLVAQGAGFVVREPAAALAAAEALLGAPQRLAAAGKAARSVVLDQRGATQRSLAVLEPWL